MNEIHQKVSEARRVAWSRYCKAVVESLDADDLPKTSELRSILSDVGRSLIDFANDINRARQRSLAVADLMQSQELETQTPTMAAAVAAQRTALHELRDKQKRELHSAEMAMHRADGQYSCHLENISSLRREAELTLRDTCPPHLVAKLSRVIAETVRVSQALALARVASNETLPDKNPETERRRLERIEIARDEAARLEAQLHSLQTQRAELEAQIFADDPAIEMASCA